jgi:NAD-dependent dihydropyrimidine dehydrogenase PreA subunit
MVDTGATSRECHLCADPVDFCPDPGLTAEEKPDPDSYLIPEL